MKRDMKVVKAILEFLEGSDEADGTRSSVLTVDGVAPALVQYHLKLISDAGFVDAGQQMPSHTTVKRLTWQGHEYLDKLRGAVSKVGAEGQKLPPFSDDSAFTRP
jgi:hypothetical protein